MKLTDELKMYIDAMSYEQLLYKWRFAPVGDPIFQDESGEYFSQRIRHLRSLDPEEHVRASKAIG